MKTPLVVFFLLLLPFCMLGAQMDDSIFDNPEDTVLAVPKITTMVPNPEDTLLSWSGTTTLTAGYVYGWKEWDQPGRHQEGMVLVSTLKVDAEPYPWIAVHSSLTLTYPSTDLALTMTELYVDADAEKKLFVRAGKYATSWGSARIFNVVNLASKSATDMSVRSSLPFDGGSLTWLLTIPVANTVAGNTANTNLTSTALDGAGNAVRLNLFGSGYDMYGTWRYDGATSSTDFALGLKLSPGGYDFFGDCLLEVGNFLYVRPTWVAGTFKEWTLDPKTSTKLQVYGEYQYDQRDVKVSNDQRLSVAFKFTGLSANGLELGSQWTHAFKDGSGTVLFGSSFRPADGLCVKAGLPLTYGDVTSYRIALGLKVEISLAY